MYFKEYETCYLLGGMFPNDIIAGFTKRGLKGNVPGDLGEVLRETAVPCNGIAWMDQAHGAEITLTNSPGMVRGDGIFTGESGLMLVIRTADCLPILLYDEASSLIGAVHMGWRSAKGGILDNIPCGLSQAYVMCGPGMRSCCYEVGSEFAEHKGFNPFLSGSGGNLVFDPIGFVRGNMLEKGLLPERFHDAGICTGCSPEGLFSWRRERTANRTLSFIMKKG